MLAYPEMASIGDIDNAIATLVFADGRLGVVDLTRNGVLRLRHRTELLGDEGTLRIGYLRETPIFTLTKNNVAHDTVPYFMERFERAYTLQLENFAQNVLRDRVPPVVIKDGVGALRCRGGDRRLPIGSRRQSCRHRGAESLRWRARSSSSRAVSLAGNPAVW